MKAAGDNAEVIGHYRTLIARLCILSGCLAVAMGIYQAWIGQDGRVLQGRRFYLEWISVLGVVLVSGGGLWWRLARATGKPFWSSGTRRVLFAFLPALLTGAVVSYEIASGYDEFELCVLCWVMCYAAGLLSIRQVLPPFLQLPGWKFLVTGMLIAFFWRRYGAALAPQFGVSEAESAAAIMVLSFGLLHLVHGTTMFLTRRE